MGSDIDMLSLMLAREGKERSRALPQRAYGDPANFAKFERERMEQYKLSQEDEAALRDCLELWVRFMGRDDSCLSWRGRSVMLDSDASADSQQLYDRADNKAAEAVNGCIDSLPRHLAWAIGKGCGINGVWRFPNLNYLEALVRAKFDLVARLKLNHETSNYFK